MCVFHQTSSHLPPHPTALDHRTSRSTPLISLSPLSLFLHSLIVFEISAPYFHYNAFLSLVHWLLISWLVFLSVQSPRWSLLLYSLIFRSPFPCVSSQCWISAAHMLSLWLKVYQPDPEPVRIPLLWSEPCSCNLRNLSSNQLCAFLAAVDRWQYSLHSEPQHRNHSVLEHFISFVVFCYVLYGFP